MAKKSIAALSAVPPHLTRPKPPSELTDEQRELWRSIVATKPADWFGRDSQPLLVQYCRHQARAAAIAKMIEDAVEDGGNLRTLFNMESVQSRAIAMLGTRLRLTPQSRYTSRSAATAA